MISGRVPTTVMTFSFFMAVSLKPGRQWCRAGLRSKISLAHSITIISSSPTLVMSCVQPGTVSTMLGLAPRGHAAHAISPVCDVPEPEPRVALDHQELLGLAVVVVAAACHARVRGEVRELAAIRRLQHLDEHTARIAVPRHVVGEAARAAGS